MNLISPKDFEKNLPSYIKEFSKDTLPVPKYHSFKYDEWASYVKDDKESFLKYGTILLTFAIKVRHSVLVDKIYKNCLSYFKEDISNNRMFLSIITSAMPLLNEYYPEYINRYSLETNMIMDNIGLQSDNLHLYPQNLQIINLTKSIPWSKYNNYLSERETLGLFIPIIQFSIIIECF